MAFSGRFRELLKKYGKVALGVHCSVSAASVTGLYIAIKNNVDIESVLEKVGMGAVSKDEDPQRLSMESQPSINDRNGEDFIKEIPIDQEIQQQPKQRNRTADLVASSGGALTLAILCNKALFPIRVPITIALTPPIARFLRARNIIKNVGEKV